MTAVVGILNKKGVALAADSAVTRRIIDEEKVTKNGNKMVRLSNVLPISVMLTGNGVSCEPSGILSFATIANIVARLNTKRWKPVCMISSAILRTMVCL